MESSYTKACVPVASYFVTADAGVPVVMAGAGEGQERGAASCGSHRWTSRLMSSGFVQRDEALASLNVCCFPCLVSHTRGSLGEAQELSPAP